jgi:nucleotide-binding universal stress UspA family protein
MPDLAPDDRRRRPTRRDHGVDCRRNRRVASGRGGGRAGRRTGTWKRRAAARGDRVPDLPSYRERIASSAKRESIELREVAETVLARTVEKVTEEGIAVETHARDGDPAEAILEVAQEQKADLIVVGNRGLTGIERFLLGSVSSKLSHHASCSVMIVRQS